MFTPDLLSSGTQMIVIDGSTPFLLYARALVSILSRSLRVKRIQKGRTAFPFCPALFAINGLVDIPFARQEGEANVSDELLFAPREIRSGLLYLKYLYDCLRDFSDGTCLCQEADG